MFIFSQLINVIDLFMKGTYSICAKILIKIQLAQNLVVSTANLPPIFMLQLRTYVFSLYILNLLIIFILFDYFGYHLKSTNYLSSIINSCLAKADCWAHCAFFKGSCGSTNSCPALNSVTHRHSFLALFREASFSFNALLYVYM